MVPTIMSVAACLEIIKQWNPSWYSIAAIIEEANVG
jgi:hypothetical protein